MLIEILEQEEAGAEDGRVETNDINLAPPETQEQYWHDYRERHHMEKSAWVRAKENISNEKIFNYRSGVTADPPFTKRKDDEHE